MRCGLFGKLPVKRDFVAEAVPRGFLPAFEPWLQGAVGASRLELGPRWQDVYLRAPIWRFWLGANHCGRTAIGAFMPSVDGIGRYFPLAVMVLADEGRAFAPPTEDRQDGWFDAVEDFLLSALDEDRGFDTVVEALAALPVPVDVAKPEAEAVVVRADGTLVGTGAEDGLDGVFGRLGAAEAAATAAMGTFWWTIGGEGMPATGLARRGLPEAAVFTGFLTGAFG